jgi:hypothetical protein
MVVDINWNLATAQPNMLQLAQQGFEQGRAQKMQGIQDQALAKISANPNDASAINALLPVNPELYGRLSGALQQRQQAEQQAAQQATRQQAIGGALSQLDGLPEPVRMLAQSDPEGAMQLWEMSGKMDEQQAAGAKANAERLAAVVTGLAELPPEQRFAQAVQLAPQFGLDPARITPESLSDQGIQAILAQAMGVKGVLDYRLKEREFGATQSYRAQTLGVQMRGQDMTDARARAAAASGGAVGGMGKAPSGYRWKADGTLEPIPGGPGEGGKLTEGEAKATGLYRSAAASAKALNDLAGKNWNPSIVARTLAEGGATAQTALSPLDRRAYNAFRNLAMASLRLESGAALTPQEISLKAMQFIPLPGDDQATLADKAEQRGAALSALRDAGGRGTRDLPRVTGGAPKATPDKRVAGGTLTAPVNGVREWRP